MGSTYIWVDTIASSDGVRKVCCPDGYRATARIANTREEVYVIIESVKTCFRRLEMIVEQDVVCASLVEINNC